MTRPTASPAPIPKDRAAVRPSGVVTWLVAVGPLWWLVAGRPELLGDLEVLGAVLASLVFGAGFLTQLRREDRPNERFVLVGLLQVVAGLTTAALVPFPMSGAPTPALLTIVALPQFVLAGRERLALGVIAIQTAALAWIYGEQMGSSVGSLLFTGSALGFQLFAFSTARLVTRESRARADLSNALDELSATQAVLASSERLGERVRIARDLHDSVGHHLTTLSLHLDLARRQGPDAARRTVETAHSICRVLLAELRDVLADVRSADAEDLGRSIADLTARLPGLEITSEIDDDLSGIDPDIAQLSLRAIQEALTNALRHAEARHVRIALRREADLVIGSITDDGRGFQGPRDGGGLKALSARIRDRGGEFDVGTTGNEGGTTVSFRLPVSAHPAGVVP